mmetsp:Transcript_28877/g.93083  ORF Transcript_28877/g.93083 Transcript_28877/m.93083 type:complete len:354 (+) Transcript_28877:423-1484(+)
MAPGDEGGVGEFLEEVVGVGVDDEDAFGGDGEDDVGRKFAGLPRFDAEVRRPVDLPGLDVVEVGEARFLPGVARELRVELEDVVLVRGASDFFGQVRREVDAVLHVVVVVAAFLLELEGRQGHGVLGGARIGALDDVVLRLDVEQVRLNTFSPPRLVVVEVFVVVVCIVVRGKEVASLVQEAKVVAFLLFVDAMPIADDFQEALVPLQGSLLVVALVDFEEPEDFWGVCLLFSFFLGEGSSAGGGGSDAEDGGDVGGGVEGRRPGVDVDVDVGAVQEVDAEGCGGPSPGALDFDGREKLAPRAEVDDLRESKEAEARPGRDAGAGVFEVLGAEPPERPLQNVGRRERRQEKRQ